MANTPISSMATLPNPPAADVLVPVVQVGLALNYNVSITNLLIAAPQGVTNGTGQAININAGDGNGTGAGGSLNLSTGNGYSGAGGSMNFTAGSVVAAFA